MEPIVMETVLDAATAAAETAEVTEGAEVATSAGFPIAKTVAIAAIVIGTCGLGYVVYRAYKNVEANKKAQDEGQVQPEVQTVQAESETAPEELKQTA